MPHWRTLLQSENFCSADLWDDAKGEFRRAIFKIVKVKGGTVTGEQGRKKQMPFVWLEDERGNAARAPLGLNATNGTTIENILGPDYAKWLGGWIGLFVVRTDGPKGPCNAIRVHPKAVQQRVNKPGLAETAKAEQPPTSDLDDADKRAIEMAEAQETGR